MTIQLLHVHVHTFPENFLQNCREASVAQPDCCFDAGSVSVRHFSGSLPVPLGTSAAFLDGSESQSCLGHVDPRCLHIFTPTTVPLPCTAVPAPRPLQTAPAGRHFSPATSRSSDSARSLPARNFGTLPEALSTAKISLFICPVVGDFVSSSIFCVRVPTAVSFGATCCGASLRWVGCLDVWMACVLIAWERLAVEARAILVAFRWV